ncbi:LysM peptidoglycan-binding domain-containing protein [Tenacibaculum maritimum]|nr:LysM peptidoglycan-binding domain-containing protein [Tenacibaculum maritimum]MDB0612565.1 LysM peptidoglycan-binding domain-containing protein [Tenacibaculum maritimum]
MIISKLRKELFILVFTVSVSFSQEKTLPEGWDEILLEGKTAYMNLVTGDVSYNYPEKPFKKERAKEEFDPTITHRVKKGETLYAIARKYGIRIQDIYNLNAYFDYDHIKPEQDIVIGYKKEREQEKEVPLEWKLREGKHHIVKKGETLYQISRIYGISVKELKERNGIEFNRILVGEVLEIE